MTRPSRVGWVRFPHSPATTVVAVALLISATPAFAQTPAQPPAQTTRAERLDRVTECLPTKEDTTVAVQVPSVMIGPVAPKSSVRPCRVPISPGSAFLRSFLIPGSGQLRLDRKKAAGIFIVAEVGTLAMSVKSWNDLRLAKKARNDTIMTPTLDLEGDPVLDPETGEPQFTITYKNPNLVGRIRARRTHLEDWLAGVVFNHLFSGADAFVAAHLADFDTNVETSYVPGGGIRIMARVAW